MRRLLGSLRPSEWVALGFLGYCLGRLAATGFAGLDPRSIVAFPTADVVAAAFAFVLLKLSFPLLRALPRPKRSAAATVGIALFSLTLFSLDAPRGDVNLPWLARLRPALIALDLAALAWGAYRATQGDFLGAVCKLVARLRDWIPPVALLCFYPLIPLVMAGSRVPDRDTALLGIDRFLFFGANPSFLLEHIVSGPLSEWTAFCYSAYIAILLVGLGALYLREDPRPFRELAFGLTLALACGYVGYTLVPAQGPMFTEHFGTDLSLYYLKSIKEALMDAMRVPRDCFPSLHTAVTLVVANSLRRHARILFLLFCPIVITMPFACVYLRYHYVVDVLAGGALAAVVTAFVAKISRLETHAEA